MLSDYKTFTRRERLFVVITLFYIAYSVFPAVAAITHIPVFVISLGVTVAVACLYPENLFGSKFLKWFYAYAAILFVYCIVGHKFKINGLGYNALSRNLLIETAWILPNLLTCVVLFRKKKLIKTIGIGAIILIFVSFVTILPTLVQSAGILRQNIRDSEDVDLFNPFLPSYTLMSSYSYFFPVICYGMLRFKGKLRFVFLVLAAILFYVIFKTEITTSMLVMFGVTVMSITYKDDKKSQSLTALFVAILIFFLYETGILLAFVDFMGEQYEGTAASPKFQDFHNMLVGESSDNNLSVREHCREISLNSFYSNPIFGAEENGGHSSILDRLGTMGLVGFIPWAAMIFTLMKSSYNIYFNRSTKFFYLCGAVAVLIFLYMKGLFSGEGMLCLAVILPSSLYALEQIANRTQNEE